MIRPLVIIIALVLVLLGVRWFRRLPAYSQGRIVRTGLLVTAGAILLIGVAGGRINPFIALMGALPLLLPLIRGLIKMPLPGATSGGSSARPGQQSTVRTRMITMVLDHDSGELSGTVNEGPYAGRCLADLTLTELLALLGQCRAADEESVRVLEAYLDRTHQDAWREHDGNAADEPARSGVMNAEQAREILGVEIGATREDIIAAHRRLMQRLHPDRGGSNYLAAIINEAKTALLKDS